MKHIRLIKTLKIGNGDIGHLSETRADQLRILVADKKLLDRYTGKSIRKIGVSLSSGCGVGCIYCFTNNYSYYCPLLPEEIVEQVHLALSQKEGNLGRYDEVKISFKQMGDPMLNPDASIKAIYRLYREFPDYTYVVSTSAPKTDSSFLKHLELINRGGAKIRLQISCHTTSDQERACLCPKRKMMNFREISEIVADWKGGLATLNFVMLDGFTYSVNRIKELFDPSSVFIKINYLDHNRLTKKYSLRDMEESRVKVFTDGLRKEGFQFAYRH